MAVNLNRTDCQGVQNSVYPLQRTDGSDDMLWSENEEAENGRNEGEEDEDMKMDTVKTIMVATVTVTGKRYMATCFVYELHERVQHFFLSRCLIRGTSLEVDKYIFSL